MTNESWRPESPWWRLSEDERDFWMEQWRFLADPFTFVEILGAFLQTGRSRPDADWPLTTVAQWVLGSMSRYERERLYADDFFAPFEMNDNEGLPA